MTEIMNTKRTWQGFDNMPYREDGEADRELYCELQTSEVEFLVTAEGKAKYFPYKGPQVEGAAPLGQISYITLYGCQLRGGLHTTDKNGFMSLVIAAACNIDARFAWVDFETVINLQAFEPESQIKLHPSFANTHQNRLVMAAFQDLIHTTVRGYVEEKQTELRQLMARA